MDSVRDASARHLQNFSSKTVEIISSSLDRIEIWLLIAAVAANLAANVVRTKAWTNILSAAYPDERVRWRYVCASSLAATGFAVFIPYGSAPIKMFLVKHKHRFMAYPAMVSSLLTEAIFEAFVTVLLIAWLIYSGIIPHDVIARLNLPSGIETRILIIVAIVGLAALLVFFLRNHAGRVYGQIKQGSAIMRSPWRFIQQVAAWQLLARGLRVLSLCLFMTSVGLPFSILAALVFMASGSLAMVVQVPGGSLLAKITIVSYVLSQSGSAASPSDIMLVITVSSAVCVLCNVIVSIASSLYVFGTWDWRELGKQAAVHMKLHQKNVAHAGDAELQAVTSDS